MTTKRTWSALAIAAATAVTMTAIADRHCGVDAGADGLAPARTSADFERIKKLAGEWVRLDENGRATDEVVSRVKVTAGGSAVLEILFPDTDKEMVTVYHHNGRDLILTHYCVLGNQPRMKAAHDDDPAAVAFVCDGHGTNMGSEDDKHMHQGTVTWIDDDHIRTEWLMHDKGENVYTASFDLQRRPTRAAAR